MMPGWDLKKGIEGMIILGVIVAVLAIGLMFGALALAFVSYVQEKSNE